MCCPFVPFIALKMSESASEQPSVICLQVRKLALMLVNSPSHVVIKAYMISKWKGWDLKPCLEFFPFLCPLYYLLLNTKLFIDLFINCYLIVWTKLCFFSHK